MSRVHVAGPDSGSARAGGNGTCGDGIQSPVRNREKSRVHEQIVTYAAAARLEGIKTNTIRSRIRRGTVERVVVEDRGRNGKIKWGILVASLSPAAQQRHLAALGAKAGGDGGNGTRRLRADGPAPVSAASDAEPAENGDGRSSGRRELPAARGSQESPPARSARGPMKGVMGGRLSTGSVPLLADGSVDEAAMAALGRANALARFHRARRILRQLEAEQAAAGHGHKLEALERLAHAEGISEGTLRRWQLAWRKGGDASLVPNWGKAEGTKSIRRPLQKQLLALWHCPTQPTYAQLDRYSVQWSWQHGHVAPSPSAVRRFIQRHESKMLATALRKGKTAYENEHRYHTSRDPEKLPVNAASVADHRLADTMVWMPDGKPGRPWLTAFADIRSARWTGWVIREGVSSDGVAAALRRAILGFRELAVVDGKPVEIDFPACGLPEHVYLDNGKEFTGGAMRDEPYATEPDERDFALPTEALGTVWNTLGVRVHHAIPYSAWSKPIEAFFGAFASIIENQIPGYTGRDAKRKPELLAKLIERVQILTLDQYRAVMAGLFAAWNHGHTVGTRTQTPMACYADHEPRVPEAAQLDTLLLRSAGTRVLHNHGFEIAGLGKFASEDPELVLRGGHKFVIRYTRDDRSAIVAICPRTGDRWIVPRAASDLDPDPWGMLFGRPAGIGHKQAQTIRTIQRRAISQAGRAVHDTLDPDLADPTGGWRIAAGNVQLANAEARRELRVPDRLPDAEPRPCLPEPPPERSYLRVLARRENERLAALAAIGEEEPADVAD